MIKALMLLVSVMQADRAAIDLAIADPSRPAAYRALDADRRPAEVLTFGALRPGMHVLDVGTGGGYFTEMLANVVGPNGSVTGWNGPAFAARPNVAAALGRIRARFPATTYYATPTTSMALPRGRFDLVLLHLFYHDFYWESAEFGLARVEPRSVAAELFAATKAGGAVVVVDHVAGGGRDPRAEVDATHRIDPAVVRGDFEAVGFVLDGQSDALRRPEDNHQLRIFNPEIRGKTDRFMLRFRKPGGTE
jgi:predicted methyltransferase